MSTQLSSNTIYDLLTEQIKSIDTSNLKDNFDEELTTVNIIEEQKIYFWTRLYIKDENPNIEIGEDVSITYITSGESIKTKFICYGKKGLDKDHDDEVASYTTEDDKKILCLMIDSKVINYSEEIPFIRTLFKSGYHYDYQLIKRDELIFTLNKSGIVLDYYDVDF